MRGSLGLWISLFGALALGTGCGGGGANDAGSGSDGADTGSAAAPDGGGGGADLGPAGDVGPVDLGPTYDYGTMVAPGGTIVGITPDENTVYYILGGHLFSVAPTGGLAQDRGVGPNEWYTRPIGAHLWMMYDLTADPKQGTLRTVGQTQTSSPTTIAPHVLRNTISRSDDTEHAVFATHLASIGTSSTATMTADLVATRADGTHQVTVVHAFRLGRWSASANAYTGQCELRTAFVTATTVLVALCPDPNAAAPAKTLYLVDTEAGSARTAGTNVLDFVRVGTDRTFALYRDSNLRLQAVNLRDLTVTPLMDAMMGGGPRMLDRSRFLYFTDDFALKVASFPALMPSTIQNSVHGILATSPSGNWALVYQTRTVSGLTDLFAISTGTASAMQPVTLSMRANAYVADSAFSDDGRYAFWVGASDTQGVGTVMSRELVGTGTINMLAIGGYRAATYADPPSVLMMINTNVTGRTVIADLAVAKRDGSRPPVILAGGVDALRFDIFPTTRNRILYHVPRGAQTGIYVRALPSSN